MANEALIRMEPSLLNYLSDSPRTRGSAVYRKVEPPVSEEDPVTLDRISAFMELDLRRILVWLNSGRKLTLALALTGAVAAIAWGQLVTRSYTVTTDILVDPASLQVVSDDPLTSARENRDGILNFGSKTRILTSGNVLLRAVRDLNLSQDPEFYRPPSGLRSFLRLKPDVKPDPDTAALATLQKQVSVIADERSFIASLSVSAQTAPKAIEISKAIVEAFQVELATADAQNASRMALALDERLGDLKREVLEADARVEAYKRAHNLSSGENGQLVSTQTLSQLNTEINTARSRAINAQASYDELREAGDSPLGGQASVSPALSELLQTAGMIQQQYEDQAAILGTRHPAIVRLQARLSSVKQQVTHELERARSAAKAELDKANAALAELTSKMREIEASTFDDNQSQIELRELQRDAAAKAAIYENFISRTRQITEREQINTNNIRVISEALPPSSRSWPPSSLTLLVLGGVIGLLLGVGLSVMRGILWDLRSPSSG